MACKNIHSHGYQNQENPEHRGCDYNYHLAAKTVRFIGFPAGYICLNDNLMNIKRIFGALLTVLGIAGLIYAAVLFMSNSSSTHSTKGLIIYGVLGLVFFIAGIGLVRTTKDET